MTLRRWGMDTIDDVVTAIQYLLDRAAHSEPVRELAATIINGSNDQVASVYDWVKAHVSYVPDPTNIELFTSPSKMVADYNLAKPLQEDCDGFAILIVALLRAIGIKSSVVLLDLRGDGFDHAVAQAYSSVLGKDILVDASTDKVPLGWEIKCQNKLIVP